MKQHAFFFLIAAIVIFISTPVAAQLGTSKKSFNHQDSLRGSVTPERAWWDVQKYSIDVTPDYINKTISGSVAIQIKKIQTASTTRLQIDLQQPMILDKAAYLSGYKKNSRASPLDIPFTREGNVYWLETSAIYKSIQDGDIIVLQYHGKPREAINPPWDGGWIWKKDEKGRPWMTVACQGLGASVWYPCKDYQGDEPDLGATLTIRVADSLTAVGNGRLTKKTSHDDGTTSWEWNVKNPINNYNIIPYIGKYVNWEEKFAGEKGELDCSYWVLDYDLEKSKTQFGRDVKKMLKCFEEWFGPYPFYEDSYKLVESSHLGMEHQSAVAYGNKFMNGYLGMDLSGTGRGKDWDYIIVHESGHEWFANNITTNDLADMWVHEGFTTYSEVLFVECQQGKEAADEYCQGLRRGIRNSSPVIGPYGVNKEGSEDMYPKGANMLHTIRQIINDDVKFKEILRGLNKDFYHKTVDSKDVEQYISKKSGVDFSKVFDQYLRAVKIPTLEYKMNERELSYRWVNCIEGFEMPVQIGTGKPFIITPTNEWKKISLPLNYEIKDINKNFYITIKEVKD